MAREVSLYLSLKMNPKTHILLVEDDESLAFVIKDNLEKEGFIVALATNGKEGVLAFENNKPHLCILDVMLPKMDGFRCAEQIRIKDSHTPILFLTAKSLESDKLDGFKHGGDDYITKPFSFKELLCRIEVFLKRSNPIAETAETCYQTKNVFFNYTDLQLKVEAEEFTLTQKEADLLRFFFTQKNKLIKREEILNGLWGDDDYFMGRSLDVFISRLRKYLNNATGIKITNHHGVGFKLAVKE